MRENSKGWERLMAPTAVTCMKLTGMIDDCLQHYDGIFEKFVTEPVAQLLRRNWVGFDKQLKRGNKARGRGKWTVSSTPGMKITLFCWNRDSFANDGYSFSAP